MSLRGDWLRALEALLLGFFKSLDDALLLKEGVAVLDREVLRFSVSLGEKCRAELKISPMNVFLLIVGCFAIKLENFIV